MQERSDYILERVLDFEARRDDKKLMESIRRFDEATQNLIAMNDLLQSENRKLLKEKAQLKLRCEMLEMENQRLRRE